MKPKQIHWRLLRLVSWLSDDRNGGLTCDDLARHVDLDCDIVKNLLSELTEYDIDDGGPWLYTKYGMYYVAGVRAREGSEVTESTGGWAALDAARLSPYIQDPSEYAWRDEAETGITRDGKRSKIQRAALPAKSSFVKTRKAEDSAHAMNSRFLSDEKIEESLKKHGLRYCKCEKKLIEKHQKRCKTCDRKRKREERMGK